MNNANSVQIIGEDLCPWWAAMTIDDNQLAILQLWENRWGKSMSVAGAVTTIDDNQLGIMPTLSKSSEKIYVPGGRPQQLMTINWQYFNSGKIIGENLCPWRAVTTIDDNQQ